MAIIRPLGLGSRQRKKTELVSGILLGLYTRRCLGRTTASKKHEELCQCLHGVAEGLGECTSAQIDVMTEGQKIFVHHEP